MHGKIIGGKKFLRNTSNNVDEMLIIVFSVYFLKRLIKNFDKFSKEPCATSDKHCHDWDMSLPEQHNVLEANNRPSLDLIFDMFLNVVITLLTG